MTSEIINIPGFTGYGASRDGRLWSKKRTGAHGELQDEWKELVQCLTGKGYGHVCLISDDGVRHTLPHRLVALTFLGPIPEGMEINHINGVKTDNRVENLEIVTHRENNRHAFVTGLRSVPKGEKHHWSRLDEVAVRKIRELHGAGHRTRPQLAREFGVSKTTIRSIVLGLSWQGVA